MCGICFFSGDDPPILSHRQDGGSGRPHLLDAAHPVRQPDPVSQRAAEPERAYLPRHVLQPHQEHRTAGGMPVGGRGVICVQAVMCRLCANVVETVICVIPRRDSNGSLVFRVYIFHPPLDFNVGFPSRLVRSVLARKC